MTPDLLPLTFAAALLIGALVGAAGIGGVLLVPWLVYVAGLDVHAAVGVAMLAFIGPGVTALVLAWRPGQTVPRRGGAMVAAGRDPASAELSPLYTHAKELAQLPPTRIWTGRHDIFIVDSRTFVGKLRAAGVDAKLYEYEAAPHVFMAITPTREAKDVFGLMKAFLDGQAG